jgi:hypothetical protein
MRVSLGLTTMVLPCLAACAPQFSDFTFTEQDDR